MQNIEQDPIVPKLVFSDPLGRRRRLIASFAFALFIVLIVLGSAIVGRIERLNAPLAVLSDLRETNIANHPTRDLTGVVLATDDTPNCDSPTELPRPVSAFVPIADQTALSGLRRHCSDFTEVFYGSAVLLREPDLDGETFGTFPAWEFRTGYEPGKGPDRWPLLSPETGMIDTDVTSALLDANGRAIRDALPNPLIAKSNGIAGVCLDLSGYNDLETQTVRDAILTLVDHLKVGELGTCLIGPSEAGFLRDPDVLAMVELVVAVLIDPESSPAIAPSSREWQEEQIAEVTDAIVNDKLRLALPVAGISWQGGQRRSSFVSYSVAMEQAAAYEATPEFLEDAGSLLIKFIDSERRHNQIWLPDAVTTSQTLSAASANTSVVLWPIGYEDPTLWNALKDENAELPDRVVFQDQLILTGSSGIGILENSARAGKRRFEYASGGKTGLTELTYEEIPLAPKLAATRRTALPSLALTFDGLGTNKDVDAILAMLSTANIPAAFFIGLEDVLFQAESIERIIGEGHTIGLLASDRAGRDSVRSVISEFRDTLTQHALHHRMGILPVIVRRPSASPFGVRSMEELEFLDNHQARGRLVIPTGISGPYGPYAPEKFHGEILEVSLSQSLNILRFDFSSTNSSTVTKHFSTTLDLLLAEGFPILSLPEAVSEYGGQLFVETGAKPDWLDNALYGSLSITWISLEEFFLVLAVIVLFRAPIQIGLALAWRDRYPVDPDYEPEVTVVVPAFNEERVIERTINSILSSTYSRLSVIVVDDGSSDRTAEIVRELFEDEMRVELIQETNHGKWYAEDIAINHTDSPIFVVIDADTLLDREAIRHIVQPFRDPMVGAVAGTVEVGNEENFITRCQAIEYIVSQAVMRRAYQAFNGILVVPGAIGAWRTEAVRKAGFVTGDTITEDADLTVAVIRANYRIVYKPEALSYTEVPDTLAQFLKQRLRWSLGVLQVSWKHKKAILEGRGIGLISIVESIWYRLVSAVVYPLMDLVLAVFLVQSVYAGLRGLEPSIARLSPEFYLAIGALVLLDLVNLALAFRYERRWDWTLMFITPFLRLGFIQLLYISSLRALYHAISGKLDVWEKIRRTGRARMPRSLPTTPESKNHF